MPSRSPAARKGKLPSSPTSSTLDTLQRFWQRSYAGDYIGLALIVILYIPLKIFGEPFHQMFRLSDSRLQHPHAEVERVGVTMLLIYTVPLPLVLLTLFTLSTPQNRHKTHPALLGLATSMLLTTFLTDILKNAIGRPRPDLLARCAPAADTPPNDLVTVDVCTETDHHKLHDGFRSFPSGHSSLAFSSLAWTAIFLASQTGVFRPRASLTAVMVCLVPIVGATMIAVSRLEDYRHDVEDVIVGSLLGLGVAYGTWRRYWPSLGSRDCAEPYTRVDGGSGSPGGGFRRVRDEEDAVGEGRGRFSIGEDDERG